MRTRSVEWMLSSLMVAWGLVLFLPARTFANPVYHFLAVIASEETWGAFSAAVGLMRMLALTINGSWRRTPIIRALGALFGMMWWIILSFLVLFGAQQGGAIFPIAAAFYPVCLFFEAMSCFRSGFDAHEAGSFRRSW